MSIVINQDNKLLKSYFNRLPDLASECAASPRRALLVTKRKILEKLAARLRKERRTA